MDRMRTRRPIMRVQPTATASGPTYENFQPTAEWSKDSANNILLIHLPGFKREEVSVQLDNNSRKIMVRGNRMVTDDKFFRLDQSFDVPENTIIEKISGRLENGYLTLILPFQKPKIDQEKSTSVETRKSDEADGMRKKPESGEKKDEPVQQEKPKGVDEKKDEPMQEEMPKSDEQKRREDDIGKKPESTEDEPIQQETTKVSKEKKVSEEKKDEPAHQEKKDEDTIQEQKKEHDTDIDMEKKREEFALNERPKGSSSSEMAKRAEGVMEKISKRVEEGVKKAKGSRKRGSIWRDGEDGWLEFGSIDNLLEKVNRNKKVIAVAVVAFSVGFYVSHKMKTHGR